MTEEKQDRLDAIYEQERKKLLALEKERVFLKDRSIGGEHALRPSDDFIDKMLGKELSETEINKLAGEKALKLYEAERRQEADHQRFQESLPQHNASIEEQKRQQAAQDLGIPAQSGLASSLANFRNLQAGQKPEQQNTSLKGRLKDHFGEKAIQEAQRREQERLERERERQRREPGRG